MLVRLAWLLAIACLSGCQPGAPSYSVPPPRVRVGRVEQGRLPLRLTLWGEVAAPPGLDVPVGSLESGYLSKLNVAQGDQVVRGQPLAEISAGPTRDQADQAEALLDSEEAKALAAKERAARTEELLRRGAASTREAQEARAAGRIAEASVQAARAAFDAARRHLARTLVRSPIDGTVVRLLAAPGEPIASGGRAVVEVADMRRLELDAAAGASDAGRLRVGQRAQVTFEGLPKSPPIGGSVLAIAPVIDPATGTVVVRLSLGASATLPLGLYGAAEIDVGEIPDALSVPSEAIERLPAAPEAFVLVVRDDRAVQRVAVEPGPVSGDRTIVTGALLPGQRVVVGGGYALPDGTKVDVGG
ncbi:MAG: efflux RND transporter periplasmic adaptor subunit [Deltaproteobacteria bacterium]